VVVTPSSGTVTTEDPADLLPTPTPSASITGIPAQATPETQLVTAEPQTFAAVPSDGPTHDQFDDKGGLRDDGVSDDPPGDDKGGLRDDNESDDPPGDDKGGLRDDNDSDDAPGDDKGGER
jgi:hypothetical protein